jgi:pyridoxal/pyridoxine/pyridoxamine kinase
MLTGDVVSALVKAKIVKKKPTTKDARAATQAAFNEWATETGRPLCQLSRILALSVG